MYIQSGELVTISGGKRHFRIELFHSLWVQIATLVFLVGVASGIIVGTVQVNRYEAMAVSERTSDIQNQCTIISNQLSADDYAKEGVSESTHYELVQLSNIYSGRVMVIDRDYHIEEDTYDMDVGKTIVSEDVIQCLMGEGTSYYDADNQYIEVTVPILQAETDTPVGVVLASISTDAIASIRAELARSARIMEISIAAVALLLGVLLGYLMVGPFRRLTRSIEEVTEGYEDEYLEEDTYRETQRISDAVNKMLDRLKELDASRQEFVSNVSHELKTPMTSMKVLADSLLSQEEVPEELYREFMNDLSQEIEREDEIITDLLSLVKMDKNNTMDVHEVDINVMVEQALKRLQPIAAERNIELVLESVRPVKAEVDETRLSLAVTNLVENAIKYNHDNGWVHVTVNADAKNFYLEVADSGTGIPQKEMEHIFERFYRVDKSHSQEISGTGLGLSIARSSVVMHRGSIKVDSQLGEGATFTVQIPLKYIS